MRVASGVLAIGLVWYVSGAAKADPADCAMLLRQDIFNRTTVIDKQTKQTRSLADLCSSSNGGSSNGFNLGYAGATLGANQASRFATAYCNENFSESDIRSDKGFWHAVIDPNVINAASQCLALEGRGLHTKINSNYDTNTLDVSLRFDTKTGTKISDVILTGNIKCTGDFYDEIKNKKSQGGLVLSTDNRGFACSPIDDKPNSGGDIPAGNVAIFTDWETIHATLPRRMAPSLEQRLGQAENNIRAITNNLGNGVHVVVHTGSIGRNTGILDATCDEPGYIAVGGACAADEQVPTGSFLHTAIVTDDRKGFRCIWRGFAQKARAQAICVNAAFVKE